MSNYSFNPLQMAIKPLYEKAIADDELFAKEVKEKEARTEKPKSFAECCEYIMGEAYKYAKDHKQGNFGLAGCEDAQIVSMIKHYYDEDDIKIEKIADAKPVVKTTPATKTESKPKKEERPKETLDNTHIPMQRPKDEKEAKRESKKQAKAVEVMDMFAGMWGDDAEAETEDDLPM